MSIDRRTELPDWQETHAAIWRPRRQQMRAVTQLDSVRLADLLGIDRQKAAVVDNTERFLAGRKTNNVLLWGSRGTGKSSLIKALLNEYAERGLRVIEVDKDDLIDLPEIVDDIRDLPQRFIIFCDDLSFEAGEGGYKHLKSVLEGSIELPPDNVLIYATSNRRHLMPEHTSDNDGTRIVNNELHHGDVVEEKLSLADRFGLWLSFYPIHWDEYFRVVDHLFGDLPADERASLHKAAREFALDRANHSARVARQFWLSRQ
ncbi:ATP-binding protein [Simiduia agarivorans]|uniref:ATPase n=1 Tax=Simiduia agarivorans (strain DSM 21679 / JCM 13881 / BCRC 17597 / SA1) TaxID=1117647 RepID=K4L302_SIMAS|nr:ATP-binding protein [Simiduia agarivorans]AFV00578.1 ATPase [Simiduia agarivorans SA1 = DSM 21679]